MKTYWNGERCPAVRVRLAVGPPPKGLHPEYWAAYHIGQTRNAVRVDYNGQTFYFDDEDGSAWAKVTEGRGSPGWPSRSLYGTEVGPAAGAAGPRDDDGLWADCGDAQCARLHIADPDTASGRRHKLRYGRPVVQLLNTTTEATMTSDTPPDARQALVQYAARMLTAFGPLPEVVHNEDGTVTIHKPPGPDPIPRYAQLDVWMSLGRNSVEFEPWRNGRSYADAWAELMAGVRVAALKGALGRAAAGEEKPGQVTLQMHYHDNDGLPDQLEVIEAPPVALIGLDFLRDNPASEAGIRLWSDHRGNVFGSPGLGLGRVAYRFVGFQPGGNGQAAALIGVRVEATQEMWDQSW